MNSIFISYIIAVYNIEISLLERCVSTVIANMGNNDEVLIINDGSTNQEIDKICRKFESKNVIYFYQKNRGISAVRNFGIKTAKGRYVAFIDGDDYFINSYAAIVDDKIDKDIYFFNYAIFNNGTCLLKKPSLTVEFQNISAVKVLKSIIDYNEFGDYFVGVIWNKLFSREFLIKNQLFFNENIRKDEDGLFILKCMLANPSIKYIDFEVYVYYINLSSVCHKYNPRINNLYIDALLEWKSEINRIKKLNLLEKETLYNGYNRQIFSAIQGALHINAFNKNIKMCYFQRRRLALETYKLFDENFNLKELNITKFYSVKNHIKFNLIKRKCFLLVWLYVKITGKGL